MLMSETLEIGNKALQRYACRVTCEFINQTVLRDSINGYQSKEGERVGKFNRMQKFVGQQTNNNGWFRAKIQQPDCPSR